MIFYSVIVGRAFAGLTRGDTREPTLREHEDIEPGGGGGGDDVET